MEFEEVPVPPETSEYKMGDQPPSPPSPSSPPSPPQESLNAENESVWLSQVTEQLVNAEKEMLKEKENGKRVADETVMEEEPASKKRAYELEKLWKNINDNPSDFQAWTVLLQHVDQVSELEAGREAYDHFFARYPYCYGYWKKYADLEKRKGTKDTTFKVFNMGVDAIPLSVDLWVHYMEYVSTKCSEDDEFVRELFDRSLESCGMDFRSDKLWDMYITWETNCNKPQNITRIYDKLLVTPISKYSQHWQKFQDHARRHALRDIISIEEYLQLRRDILGDDTDGADEPPPAAQDANEEEEDDETKILRSKFMEAREKLHEETAAMSKARWPYEDAIKRPYFHVKPLEKSQLSAWRNYLEFEMKEGDEQRTQVLFERCLIACAFYEEFWMRYIRYLEDHETSEDFLRGVYIRACTIHLREKLRPNLAWSAFEEERGNVDYALQILVDVQQRIDLSLEAYMMAVAVERRRGNMEAAETIYKSCLSKFKDKEDKSYYTCIATKYARFLTLFKNEGDEAIDLIKQAVENDPSNFNLLVTLADNALSCKPPKLDVAAGAFKSGTDVAFAPNVRIMFAHRYLHFITECATESTSMNEALRLLRQIQQEIRQDQQDADGRVSPTRSGDSFGSYHRPKGSKSPVMDQSQVNTMNGTYGNQNNMQYQNYQGQGYGYNQYQQGYGSPQYQNWGYPNQQGGYGYNQGNWGNYPNYYGGQR